MADDRIVTSWKLDAKEFNKGIKSINHNMANAKAAMDIAMQGARALGRAWDSLATQGAALDRLQRNNTLSIKAATVATRGYVTQVDLLKSANMASAFALGFTDKQFAKVAKSAVIMSQKLGTDATQAINDVIVGLSRQSKKILDNLGIMVSVGEANAKYAKAMKLNARTLTDAQQKTAFMNATMKELDRLTGDTALEVKNAGDQYEILKVKISDATAEMGKATIQSGAMSDVMSQVASWAASAAGAISFMTGSTDNLGRASLKTVKSLQELWSTLSGEAGALLTGGMVTPFTSAYDAYSFASTGMTTSDLLEMYRKNANNRRLNQLGNANAKLRGMGAEADMMGATMKGGGFAKFAGRFGASKAKKRSKRRGGGTAAGKNHYRDLMEALGASDKELREMGGALNRAERGAEFGEKQIGKGDKAAGKAISESDRAVLLQKNAGLEREAARAAREHNEALRAQENLAKSLNQDYINLAAGGLASLASGMWAAADAAIMGAESFGMAMAKMLKSTLMSIAQESTVRAIMETALAFSAAARYDFVASSQHTAAAVTFGVVAAAAGAAGLGVSAGIGAAGGYSSGSTAAGGSSASGGPDYSPNFSGTRSSNKKQPIHVNLYLGDPGDPSAALMIQKQLTAQLAA